MDVMTTLKMAAGGIALFALGRGRDCGCDGIDLGRSA
jgi:hypothetical protein